MLRQVPRDPESTPQKRSPRQRLEDLAADGQVEGLVEMLSRRWIEGAVSADEKTALLRQAVQVHADKGVPALIECVFQVMIAYDLQFLLRSQLQINQDFAFADRRDGSQVGDPIPMAINQRIPRLMSQEDRLLELIATFVKSKRALAIMIESPACPAADHGNSPSASPVPPESPEQLRFFRLAPIVEQEGNQLHGCRDDCAVPGPNR